MRIATATIFKGVNPETIFQEANPDSSSKVTINDLASVAVNRLGENLSEAETAILIKALDISGSGQITVDEFC